MRGARACLLRDLAGRRSARVELEASAGWQREAFVLLGRDSAPRAYLNSCPHRGQPVDLGDGKLFLASGEIECQAHGAVFDPETGACLRGPCAGASLQPLSTAVRGGEVFVLGQGLAEDD